MGEVLKFQPPRYQFLNLPDQPAIVRIVWIEGKPNRVESFVSKDFTWVRLQRYKEVEIINKHAEHGKYAKR